MCVTCDDTQPCLSRPSRVDEDEDTSQQQLAHQLHNLKVPDKERGERESEQAGVSTHTRRTLSDQQFEE